MLRSITCGLTAALCMAAVAPRAAQAQEALDLQLFRPRISPQLVFSTEGAGVIPHKSLGGGLLFNYANNPLRFQPRSGDEVAVIDHQLAAHAMVGFGLFDRFQLELGLPVYLIHTGDTSSFLANGASFSGVTLGDVSVRGKGHIWSNDRVGLAASLEITGPTGDAARFTSDPGPTVTPSLIAQLNLGDVMLAGNLGARLRGTSTLRDLELGSALEYRAGAQWAVLPDLLALDAEVFGRFQLVKDSGEQLDALGAPLEVLVGPKLTLPSGLHVMLGAGTGVLAGIGAAQPRVVAGVTYTKPLNLDGDGDGIPDREDKCPEQAEDKDGFQDDDGCPDLDNDGDGVPDREDKCPDQAEDKDGWKDDDGCPEDDDDKDGDGIPDKADKCPDKPEDKDGWKDEDGCPEDDDDKDGDGIPDKADKCPDKPEDKDGFEDADGCPDPDNDGDGILDGDDRCPNTAGDAKGQGCPMKVVVTTKTIELPEKIFFDFDKDAIKPQFHRVLNDVAAELKKYPQIKLVEIAGHTDQRGERAYNKELSQRRAEAVRRYLIKRGIAASRLRAVGYGITKPLVANEVTDADSAKNRRVVFDIIKQDPIEVKQAVPASP